MRVLFSLARNRQLTAPVPERLKRVRTGAEAIKAEGCGRPGNLVRKGMDSVQRFNVAWMRLQGAAHRSQLDESLCGNLQKLLFDIRGKRATQHSIRLSVCGRHV